MESSSCARQSQRSELRTSPVRHCECTLTSGSDFFGLKGARILPRTRGTGSFWWPRPRTPGVVKRPWRVGSRACATSSTRRFAALRAADFFLGIRIHDYSRGDAYKADRAPGFTEVPRLASVETRAGSKRAQGLWTFLRFLREIFCLRCC